MFHVEPKYEFELNQPTEPLPYTFTPLSHLNKNQMLSELNRSVRARLNVSQRSSRGEGLKSVHLRLQ